MADDPRTYLLDRFTTDAATLRERVAQLTGHKAPEHGPDAETSALMAEACDRVVEMLHDIPDDLDRGGLRDALLNLGPALHGHAERTSDPFQKSVYTGAAARIAEIVKRDAAADGDGEESMFDDGDDFDDDADGDDV